MKDPNARNRAYRRLQDLRRKNKIRRKYADVMFDYEHRHDIHERYYKYPQYNGICYMDEHHWLESWIGRTASHNHSCLMCGKHRKLQKPQETRDEQRSCISLREQILEIYDDGIEEALIDWFFETYYQDE